jgi:hypothetical protein
MLQKLVKEYSRKEKFEEEETKKDEVKKEETQKEEKKSLDEDSDTKMTAKKETYADKQLDKNLFIINTFEDLHERKITTDELKHFSELFSDNDVSKKIIKDKIENYKNEKFSSNQDNFSELLEVSKKLTAIIQKMKTDADNNPDKTVEKYENFKGIMPFSNEKKYVMLR